jgi:DNA replication licensing factor MCM2
VAATRRDSESSLPPSSPFAPLSDTDDSVDERDAARDLDDDGDVVAEDEDDGEDLFGQNLEGCMKAVVSP